MTERDELPPLPISGRIGVERLSDEPMAVALTPDAAETKALARHLGVDALVDVALTGTAVREGKDGARVEAQVTARVRQSCVITLEPIETALDLPVTRHYRRGAEAAPEVAEGAAIEIQSGDDDDGPDPLGDEIGLAELLIETLALAIEPYPRAEGAALGAHIAGPPGVEPLTDEAARPFAKLAALRAAKDQETE